ncbi:hypothetical protein PDG61_16640 [Mycolicibacterium sp. BiH015]|uniref:hypothetical protein n=1 Tax=Mycolicibacterium sp. BiH015 TaxID=3018808 RepID=UPI0022E2D4F6|nr:hypothetical protein [Mycolicibacterium sp. BiH015]MDA2892551.1 hypothetical protein [Mycolicibacterium sp. BiH015]
MAADTTLDTQQPIRRWRWTALALAVVQLFTPAAITQAYGEFLSTGATNAALITPAGYAFSIWGPITLLCAITCALITRFGLNAPWERQLLVAASTVFVGFVAWLLAAAQDWLWVTVAIFAVMVTALLWIMRTLTQQGASAATPTWLLRLTIITLGLYLGWSGVAVFANIAAALIDGGWPSSDVTWQAVILVVAAVAACGVTLYLRGTPGYVAATLWALVAISIGAAQRGSTLLAGMSAVAAGAVLAAAITAVLTARSRRSDGG